MFRTMAGLVVRHCLQEDSPLSLWLLLAMVLDCTALSLEQRIGKILDEGMIPFCLAMTEHFHPENATHVGHFDSGTRPKRQCRIRSLFRESGRPTSAISNLQTDGSLTVAGLSYAGFENMKT